MPTHDILPGVNALGCGFNPFDTAIEATKRRLFAFDFKGDQEPYSDASAAGTFKTGKGVLYSVPRGVTVDPAGSSGVFSSKVFQSQHEVEENLAAEAHAKGGFGLFKAEVNASYARRTEGSTSYFFASGESEITLWTLSLARELVDSRPMLTSDMQAALKALPRTCHSDRDREAWDDFFASYGTHYISACRVGGYCLLTSIVRKTSALSSSTIKAQLDIEYGASFKGGGSASREKQSKVYRENSEKELRLRGGDTTLLGRMESDPNAHAMWAETIWTSPANRGYALREIWQLFPDKAQAAAAEAAFVDYCYRNSPYAASFDGAKSVVDVISTRNLDLKDNACFEAWIYPVGPGNARNGSILLNKDLTYEIGRLPDGRIQFAFAYAGQKGWHWVNSNLSAPLGIWSHVAVSFNAQDGKVTVTLNGQTPFQVKREGPLRPSVNKLNIGRRPNINQPFHGYMEEVRIWNVPRSVAEIQASMYTRMTGAEPGLVGLWPLNDATKDLARDLSVSANQGKLRDADWAEPPRPSPLTLRMQARHLRTDASGEE